MENGYNEIFTRNIGLFTAADQDKLRKCSIGVAGLGGVGGLLAERLIRLGVGQLKISDPGVFEKSNLNRQIYSSLPNLGRNKAEVIYSHIKDINPEASISWSPEGVRTESEAESFIDGCDIIIDERHIGLFKEAILLQRAARRKGIYYMFSVAYGFGALIAIFDPLGMTLEEYDGIPLDVDIEDPEKLNVPFEKIMPVIPSYASTMDVDLVRKMHLGELPGSVTGIGAGLASILAANESANIILQKRRIVTAPEFIYVDLLDQTFTVKNIVS